jgi:large subunit ribosomal protein L21
MTDAEKVTETPVETGAEATPAPAPTKKKKTAKAPELSPYAVIETGGKQYRVSVGDRITVERLADDAGSEITLNRVLLLGGDGSTRIGTPIVEGATVTASVDDHHRGEKIVVFKYKPKKRYRRKQGHRQELTRLTITGITG